MLTACCQRCVCRAVSRYSWLEVQRALIGNTNLPWHALRCLFHPVTACFRTAACSLCLCCLKYIGGDFVGLTLCGCEFAFIVLKYSKAEMMFAFALKIQTALDSDLTPDEQSVLHESYTLEAFIAGLIIAVLVAVTRKWKCPVSSY